MRLVPDPRTSVAAVESADASLTEQQSTFRAAWLASRAQP